MDYLYVYVRKGLSGVDVGTQRSGPVVYVGERGSQEGRIWLRLRTRRLDYLVKPQRRCACIFCKHECGDRYESRSASQTLESVCHH